MIIHYCDPYANVFYVVYNWVTIPNALVVVDYDKD